MFLLLIVATVAYPASKPLTFPQGTRLEWCIRDNLPNPYINLIYPEDAAKVTTIICNDSGITSLEGIEQFPNLKHIKTGGRGTLIDDLTPLANLQQLTHIEIIRSHIDNLTPIMGLTRLTSLDLSENHVTDLTPLDNMTQLTRLSLYHQGPDSEEAFEAFNKAHPIKLDNVTDTLSSKMEERTRIHLETDYVKDITPLDNLTNLYGLTLESNKITDLTPLMQMHNLEYLHVGDNRLTSIEPLDNLTSLQMVDLGINALTTLAPLLNSPEIYTVYAANNRLTKLDFIDNKSKIRYLDVTRNAISDISPISYLYAPTSLVLDKNKITDISPIKRIINDRRLQELGLSYNCIPALDNMSILYFVNVVRKEHQCEPAPDWNLYDEATVVNKDMLMSSGGESNAPNSPDDNITRDRSKPTGPGGCSMSSGSPADIAVLTILSVAAIMVRRRLNWKRSRR
ncbi:MAG: leucine-rich repeat domain-containing protein [Deferribacteraceae bacterium]|nr:leucine-rich repeat domain-containing protein [Deferribacteraceae bacterium]